MICSGGPTSMNDPSSMKKTRSAASRAKDISWVTTIIVVPAWASSSMTSRTSPTSVGSSAEVGSSNSSTFGSMASARAIATRCFWPPDSRDGYSSRLSYSPTPEQVLLGDLDGLGPSAARTRIGASIRLPMHLHVREQIELLEDHLGGSRIIRICSRCARLRRLSGSASSRTPPTSTVPTVGSSRKLMQRSSVLLPAPDRPMITDRLARVDLEVARRGGRGWAEVLLDRRSPHDRLGPGGRQLAAAGRTDRPVGADASPLLSAHRSRSPRPSVARAVPGRREEIVSAQYTSAAMNSAWISLARLRPTCLGAPQDLLDPDDADQRAVLDHRHEVVADRRDDDPDRLRQDDPAQDRAARACPGPRRPRAGRVARPGCRRGRSRSCTRRS